MNTSQVTGTMSKSLPSPYRSSDLPQMVSRQGVLLNIKSPQEMRHVFSSIVSNIDHIFDYQHVRMQQGAMEINMVIMSSLPSDLSHEPSLPEPDASAYESDLPLSTQTVSLAEGEACHDMIQKEICHIFQYKRFQNDTLLANSFLHRLNVVQEATRAWMRERKLVSGTLSKHDKARVLRDFLSRAVIQELSPDPGNPPPRNLPKLVSPPLKNQWIEYLILLWQHVDGEARQRVVKILDMKTNCLLGNGTYSRRSQAARVHLAALIWQKEMQTQKGDNA